MSDQAVLLLRKQLKGAPSDPRAFARFRPRDPRAAFPEPRSRAPPRASRARVPVNLPPTPPPAPRPPRVSPDARRPFPPRRAARPELSRNPIEGFSAGLVDDSNVFEWQITIMGPPDTM
jgi:hypothetical protein